MNCVRTVVGLVLWCSAVDAASLDVTPLEVFVPPGGQPTAVRVANSGSEAVLVQAKVLPWVDAGELDKISPVRDLIVVPPVFELRAKQRQVLRVALRTPLAGPREQAYRLVISEVPREIARFNGISMSLRLNLPVFATPFGAEPHAGWLLRDGRDGDAELVLTNMGTARVVIDRVTLQASAGQAFMQLEDAARTVLAGESKSWPLDTPLSALPDVVEVRAETNRGPLVAEVRPRAQ